MEVEGGGAGVVVRTEPGEREPLTRENEADGLAGEQTWPTEEELADAEVSGRKNSMRRRH